MRRLRLALTLWLEVELSAAILVLPLACGDLAGFIALDVWGRQAWPVLIAFATGVGATIPLAWWGRPVAKAFRGWR